MISLLKICIKVYMFKIIIITIRLLIDFYHNYNINKTINSRRILCIQHEVRQRSVLDFCMSYLLY